MTQALDAEEIVQVALKTLKGRPDGDPSQLEHLPAALYVTDRHGTITWYNKACIGFTGRTPQAQADRWCVTWKMLTDRGEPLAHDRCAMALAIKQQRPIRGVTAIAERPDGRRVAFRPYPTPLFDAAGEFTGAINVLEDITAVRRRDEFLAHAGRCRRLARQITDRQTITALQRMAEEYEGQAAELAAELAADLAAD
jgi:PAS domain S-box-containing protein